MTADILTGGYVMTKAQIIARILDPSTRNIGAVGAAMVAAARKETKS